MVPACFLRRFLRKNEVFYVKIAYNLRMMDAYVMMNTVENRKMLGLNGDDEWRMIEFAT